MSGQWPAQRAYPKTQARAVHQSKVFLVGTRRCSPTRLMSGRARPASGGVRCQGSVPPTGSQIFSSTSSSDRALFSADPDTKHVCMASNLSKALAQPLALTFPDTSLFIKVVRSLERKIDERLRSSTPRIAANR